MNRGAHNCRTLAIDIPGCKELRASNRSFTVPTDRPEAELMNSARVRCISEVHGICKSAAKRQTERFLEALGDEPTILVRIYLIIACNVIANVINYQCNRSTISTPDVKRRATGLSNERRLILAFFSSVLKRSMTFQFQKHYFTA